MQRQPPWLFSSWSKCWTLLPFLLPTLYVPEHPFTNVLLSFSQYIGVSIILTFLRCFKFSLPPWSPHPSSVIFSGNSLFEWLHLVLWGSLWPLPNEVSSVLDLRDTVPRYTCFTAHPYLISPQMPQNRKLFPSTSASPTSHPVSIFPTPPTTDSYTSVTLLVLALDTPCRNQL